VHKRHEKMQGALVEACWGAGSIRRGPVRERAFIHAESIRCLERVLLSAQDSFFFEIQDQVAGSDQ
jgi:hypothetical protein